MPDVAPHPARRRPVDKSRGKRTLLLLAAVSIAPVLASYAVYYLFPRDAHVNYGTLLPTAPAPAIEGVRADGGVFHLSDLRGRWVLLLADAGPCDATCERMLYATRQARTMQGKEQDRIVRVRLAIGDEPAKEEMLAQHPGLVAVRVTADALAPLSAGRRAIFIVDPHGNLVLSYPTDPDIRGLANDLARLLRASSIG